MTDEELKNSILTPAATASQTTTVSANVFSLPPLHLSAQSGDVTSIARLLDTDSDANEPASDGTRPLHWAVLNNKYQACKYLLERGADPNLAGGPMAATPLHWACRSGLVYMAKLLVDNGANLSSRDEQGLTPLHAAVHSSNVLLVIYLLHLNVNVDDVDSGLRTSLHWAAYQGDHLTINALIKFGANVAARDDEGFTPLHRAVASGTLLCIVAMLKAGGDVKDLTDSGKSIWQIAKESGYETVVRKSFVLAGRRHNGEQYTKWLSVKKTKLLVFFTPHILIPSIVYSLGKSPWYIGLATTGVMGFVARKCLNSCIYPNAWVPRLGLLQSTLLAGGYTALHTCVMSYYCVNMIPVLFPLQPMKTLTAFGLVTGSLCVYFRAMFMNPGHVLPSNSSKERLGSINVLLDEGKFDAEHFCIYTYVRKPVRAHYDKFTRTVIACFDHYCPWLYNAVGIGNHRMFVIFLTLLNLGLVSIGNQYYNYLMLLSPLKSLRAGVHAAPCSLAIAGLTFMQFPWILLLTFVQYVQIAKALTGYEVARTIHSHLEESFESLPPDHPRAAELKVESRSRHHLERLQQPAQVSSLFTRFLTLLGIRQVVLTSKLMVSKSGTRWTDYGFWSNCLDFWRTGGSIWSSRGKEGYVHGIPIDYYNSWEVPPILLSNAQGDTP